MTEDDDFDTFNNATKLLFKKEMAKQANLEAKKEALEDNFKRTLANQLKDVNVLKGLAQEASNATRSHSSDRLINESMTFRAEGGQGSYRNLSDKFTGINEDKPWERD